MDNIRKELYLDQPKWKQFLLYVNDVSPVSIDTKKKLKKKNYMDFSLEAILNPIAIG